MKNAFFLLISSLILITSTGCFRNKKTSITVSESKITYQLAASFDKSKTEKVLATINDALLPTNTSFAATVTYNGTVTLDDETIVEIKSTPGKLHILLNKRENSYESYLRVKKMFESVESAIKE